MQQKAQAIQGRVAAFLWLMWNRALQRGPSLAKRLHLRIHRTQKHDGDVGLSVPGFSISGTGTVSWGPPPADGTTEERLAWLEVRMTDADEQLRNLYTWHWQEARERQAVADQERSERTAEDQRTRESIADLAGGGLRLQTWGVVCLLAGTIMTAIW